MTTLNPTDGYLTLINTFTVEPELADKLLAVLTKAGEDVMRHMPGFVSANLHVSRDRCHIANYAQWRSQADYDAMVKDPNAQVHMREAANIAKAFMPVYYSLREVQSPERSA
jgi:quinol monooxygenase YgiN